MAVCKVLARRDGAVGDPKPLPGSCIWQSKIGYIGPSGNAGCRYGKKTSLNLLRECQSPSYPEAVRGKRSIQSFVQRNRLEFSQPIVKEPDFLVLWRPLLEHFPRSPRILVVGDPRDNIRSILARLRLPGDRASLKKADLADLLPGWQLYLDGSWLGMESDHYIDVMAHRWNKAYEFWEATADSTIVVRYEDFVKEKEETVRRVAAEVGLRVKYRLGAAAEYQYQPRGERGRDWQTVFGVRNLRRIEALYATGMEKFGYPRKCE